jgi:prevent-host-death family protein
MEKIVTDTDANKDFPKLLRETVENGDSFVVTSDGKPVAKLIPLVQDLDREAAERKKAAFLEYLRNKPAIDIGPWTRDELHED